MKKLIKKPSKFIFYLIATFILASIMHNVVYAISGIEESFFFTIAIVSAISVPVVLVYTLFLKFRK